MKAQFEPVMARLKRAVNAHSYAELGRLLGLSTSAYANRKKSDSIPYDAIIHMARSRKIDLEWLFFGEGTPPSTPTVSYAALQVDPELLGRVMIELRRAMHADATKDELIEAGQIASLAGFIYNKVAPLDNEAQRTHILRREAADMALTVRLFESYSKLKIDEMPGTKPQKNDGDSPPGTSDPLI